MLGRWLSACVVLMGINLTAQAAEFVELFNRKDLDGWAIDGPQKDGDGKSIWSVSGERIVCSGKAYGFLRYDKRQFSDFVLRLEFCMADKCNSGVGIRAPVFDAKDSEKTRPSYAAFEVQLVDDA